MFSFWMRTSYICDKFGASEDKLREIYSYYRSKLGEYWPFSSEQRLAQVKKAVADLKFVPIHAHLFDREDMEALTKVLRDNQAELHIANLSNIFDYLMTYLMKIQNFDDFEVSLLKPCKVFRDLPTHDEALVRSSRILQEPTGTKVTNAQEHWDFLEQMLYEDISKKHLLTGTFSERVQQLIKNIGVSMYYREVDYLKVMLATRDKSEIASLAVDRDKVFQLIDQSDLTDSKKRSVKIWIDRAIEYHQSPAKE